MKKNWTYKKLGELTNYFDDGDWIESNDQSDAGYRLIQTGNIGNGKYLEKIDKAKYVSEDTFKRLNCKEIFQNDCLISRLPDPIGRSCIVPYTKERMITAVDCSILRFKNIITPKFFVYSTQSNYYKIQIDKYSTGATRKRISRKNLGTILIPLPPLTIQEKIVSELDCINGILDKKRQQLKELDALAQSLFYQMFGDPINNEKGWEVKKLGEVAPAKEYKGEVPNKNGKYWLLNLDMVIAHTGEIIDYCYLEQNEIGNSTITFNSDNVLYSKLRPYLNKVVLPKDIGYATSELIPLFPEKVLLDKVYLAHTLRSKSFVEYISTKVAGAKMPRVSMNEFRGFPLPLPPLPLQQSFAAKIEAIEKQKALIKQSIADIETLLASRMQYWFD